MIEVRCSRRANSPIIVRSEVTGVGTVVEISDCNVRMFIENDIAALERLRDALNVVISEVIRG